jgi:6,7-dimethyl-8-ribityllumazine synthase
MKEYTGVLNGAGLNIGIVVSRFNEIITKSLLDGALDTLKRHSVEAHDISIAWVPGAYEIPLAAQVMARSQKHHAIICLGAVIRGATSHFDYVAGQSASGVLTASLQTEIPILYGILTTDTIEQAIERSGTKCGNKGRDVAVAAIEMVNLLSSLKASEPADHQISLSV